MEGVQKTLYRKSALLHSQVAQRQSRRLLIARSQVQILPWEPTSFPKMTIPYYIENPITHVETEVPQEILYYCDNFTLDADRADLRYFDCVSMHMGYYGNDPTLL